MNELRPPCEHWAEPISLLAAGCLLSDQEREVRRHIEACPDCRERFRQLTELCGALAEAYTPAGGAEAAIVARVMSAVESSQCEPSIVRMRTESSRSVSRFRSPNSWRSIMRSPASPVAAVVIFVLAVTGVALWFHSAGTTPAVADFIKPLCDAKTAKFKMEIQVEGQPPQELKVTFLAPDHIRQDMAGGVANIVDFHKGKIVSLDPKSKRATVLSFANMPKENQQMNPVAQLRSQLIEAEKNPDAKRESLGEKKIDGRQAVGYRFTSPAQVLTIWGDAKTALPIRVESQIKLIPKMATTWTDFQFDVPVDESLFSLQPPADYTVVDVPVNVAPPTESDLTASLRQYAEMTGGNFPDAFDTPSTMVFVQKLGVKLDLKKGAEPSPQQQKEMMAAIFKLNRGFMFALQLPPQADAHYAGKEVKLGAADKPIFWHRPKDAKKYRVIYADLSVRDADTPPKRIHNAPIAGSQRLPQAGR
jgi:outer membrane lipoprotein-sorting protein